MAQDAYTEGKTTSSTTDLLCSGGKVTEEMDTRWEEKGADWPPKVYTQILRWSFVQLVDLCNALPMPKVLKYMACVNEDRMEIACHLHI